VLAEYSEYVIVGIGVALSTLGFFLKKEHARLTALEGHLTEVQMTLVRNETRDDERWQELTKSLTRIEGDLEKRRTAEIKLFDLVQASKN